MGGLHFFHPGFLAGALAVAVPIVVHLLFRQRPRVVEIGSTQFLKVVLRDHARRRRIRRWVLLAVRAAGVILLALLFSRPYWVAGAGESGADSEVVLLIDRSASTAAVTSGRSAFERAQEEAEAVLKRLPERAAVHLAYCDEAGVVPAETPKVDRSLKPGYAGTDHGKALAWARDLMVLSKRRERRVVYFTDLQRSGIDRTPFDGWPAGTAFDVVDVGRPIAANLAVTAATVDRTEVRGGEPFVVSAVVANAGLFPARGVAVKLTLAGPGGVAEQAQTVTLDGGDRRVLRFALKDVRPGLYRGSVGVIGGDEFPADDRRWLAFEARAVDRVLLVDGDPGPSVFAAETYYLETALRLRGAAAPAYDPVRLALAPAQPLPDLNGFRVVALCNVATLTDRDVSALREFVSKGGRLVIFSGDRLTPDACLRLRAAEILPAEFLGNAEPGSYRVATWDREHPLLRPFSDPQHGDLRSVEFRQISRYKPDALPRVLAVAQTGEPLIVEKSLGAGSVLLFAIAADRDWGDWPVHRLFLPVVYQVFGYLTGRLPDDQRVRTLPAGPGLDRPPGVEVSPQSVVVRNLDPTESGTERASPEEFRLAYHLPGTGPTAGPVAGSGPETVAGPPDAQRPDELWRAAVWALFAILVVETFVANRTFS